MRTCLALMLTAALAVPALAQQPGRGRGGFGPGQMLANKSVQEELKLSEEQITKVKEFNTKQAEARRGFQDLSPEERKEKQAELGKQALEFAKETLKEDQAKRFKQIQYQIGGVNNREAQAELKLTDDQKEKVMELGKASFKEIGEVVQASGGNFNDPETQKKVAAIRKETAEKALGVLTDDQKKQWTEMIGKPFDYKPELPGAGGDNPKKKKKKADKDN